MSDLSQEQKNERLLWAVRETRPREIERMIAAGAKLECVDQNWNSPLYTAAAMNRLEEAEMLLKAGAKPDWMHRKHGRPPLLEAVSVSVRMTQLLLRYGANPNVASAKFGSPLFAAAGKNSEELVRILLDAGAEVDARHPVSDRTPLHRCCEHGSGDQRQSVVLAEMLIATGADINARDHLGMTPLTVAVRSGNKQMFERLVRLDGLSQHSLDTALASAVHTARDVEWLRLLVDKGADSAYRYSGKTLPQLVGRKAENAEATRRFLRSVRTQKRVESAMSGPPADAAPVAPSKDFTL